MKNHHANIARLTGALALAFSASVQATLVNGIVDTWTVDVSTVFDTSTICDSNNDCTSPTGVTVVNNQSLRWGDSTGFGQSGLDISASPSSTNVATNGAAINNVAITHLNRPITGTTLKSLDILSTLILTPFAPPGGAMAPALISFKVHYLETPNGASPCADGGANGSGVNSAGCADIYVTDAQSLNFKFNYDLDGPGGPLQNQEYFISFFESTHGLNALSAAACGAVGVAAPCLGFETPEGADTTVHFAALITTEPVTIKVPEPSTLLLGGLGIAGLARVRRNSHG
ncbi:THxN family PEP-CTERM protein [Zoogloea sp. LCSB751]|uniref:THxN family PEP-CTERM protein n=1 Tax=Zoogloea sp. LCSB751 TaxID=1965277 RepID=UPI0009A483B3|nr:THxN family PEP-CTERM protein [Zoogloea sp. LCSB751]